MKLNQPNRTTGLPPSSKGDTSLPSSPAVKSAPTCGPQPSSPAGPPATRPSPPPRPAAARQGAHSGPAGGAAGTDGCDDGAGCGVCGGTGCRLLQGPEGPAGELGCGPHVEAEFAE